MSWVIYDFSHIFICLLWFCHKLPKGEIVRTYVIHLLGTYVTILCNWLILWQNVFYLYLGRFRMYLNTSRNHVSGSSVEAFKSVQENKLKVQNYWNSTASSTASMYRGSRKLFSPCARHLLDTSYLSRFKNFRILIWFSWCNNPRKSASHICAIPQKD